MMRIQRATWVLVTVCVVASARNVSAQAFTGDARVVGMGGSAKANIALSMVPPMNPYAVIPIPLGLTQVLPNLDGFNPTSDEFDPAWAIENASNPLHYTFGRKHPGSEDPQQRFMRDLVNGELNRDLTIYQGFHLPSSIAGEGLASPAWGATIKVKKRDDGGFHGVFVGAGPYFSYSTTADFDPRLSDLLDNGTRYPNSSLTAANDTELQMAMSIVGGYRAKFALPDSSSERDGVYVGVNYRYLKGFEYFTSDANVRFDLDNQALITVNPTVVPIAIGVLEGKDGTGRALDFGVQFVRDRWEAGLGVNGIANQIEWTDLTLKTYILQSLFAGGDFVETNAPAPFESVTVELPVVTSGNVGYDDGTYAFRGSVTHGFNGNSFNGGAERWFNTIAVRGGARYSRGYWDPAFGVGIGRRIGIDIGFYGTHANLQEKQQLSMAISLRLQKDR